VSTARTIEGGWCNPSRLPVGPEGRPLCRCGCGHEVPAGRRTFHGPACVHGWKLRTDAGYQRARVSERDRGVCQACEVDTIALKGSFERARTAAHLRAARQGPRWQEEPEVLPLRPDEQARARRVIRSPWWREAAAEGRPFKAPAVRALLLGFDPDRKTWWDMDHRQPVIEGGGVVARMTAEEVLANLRTLCQPCHKRATAELAGRRAAARRNDAQPSLMLEIDRPATEHA